MLKALPTVYNHFRFASRLEARWAKYFTLLGVTWEYEKEAFDLDGLTYFPDFWLPLHRVWLEIKGEIINDDIGLKIIQKCSRLAILSGFPVLLTFNDPLNMRCTIFGIRGHMHPNAHFAACPACASLGVSVRVNAALHFLCPRKAEHIGPLLPLNEARSASRKAFEAATIARQTKFAFGRKTI